MKIRELGNLKYFVAYLFFLSMTTARFFTEAHFASFADPQNLIFHHHYWFLFVFFMFLLNFKYILRMPPKKTWWIAFCSPVILLPIIYNILFAGSGLLQLNYISARNFGEYLRDIFTFMIFSQRNQAISVELVIIVIGISIFSYYISRKIVRSVVMGFSCYLSLMILAGTILVAPHKPERVLFYVNSGMRLQNFMSFLYFFVSVITGAMLFSEELKQFFKESRKRTNLFLILAVTFFIGFQFFLKRPEIADRVMMIPHSILLSLFVTVLVFVRRQWMLKILLLIHITISSGILYNYWFGEMVRRISR